MIKVPVKLSQSGNYRSGHLTGDVNEDNTSEFSDFLMWQLARVSISELTSLLEESTSTPPSGFAIQMKVKLMMI